MVKGYTVGIRTRGTDADYRWIGTPPEEWWTRPEWGSSHLRRQPCLLVRVRPDGRDILMTRIQSTRRDGSSSRARIRYDLAFSTAPGESSALLDSDAVVQAVTAWWTQRDHGHLDAWPLGQQLDEALGVPDPTNCAALDEAVQTRSLPRSAWRALSNLWTRDAPPTSDAKVSTARAVGDDVDWIGSDHSALPSLLTRTITDETAARSLAYFVAMDSSGFERGEVAEDVLLVVDGDAEEHHFPKAEAGKNHEAPRRRTWLGCGPRAAAAALLVIGVTTLILAMGQRL